MKPTITFFFCILFIKNLNAQDIPSGYCGIQYTYDNAGNRTQRAYVCNNMLVAATADNAMQLTEVLAPNPTTGKFSVTFSKALQNADIIIADGTGRAVIRMKGNGNRVDFDISLFAAGVYFLQVKDENRLFEKKIVKQ